MADAKKFMKPDKKTYSRKKMLTQDRLMQSMIAMRGMQTKMWETMPDEEYEKLEGIFDTAIASMMAHMCGVAPAHKEGAKGADQDCLMPAT